MNIGKACAIVRNIESNDSTIREKIEALNDVLEMETDNSITKAIYKNALRWLLKNIELEDK